MITTACPENIIFRLRTGHNRLNQHMYNKFRLVETPQCDCREGDQTAEHILQHCRLTEELRKRVWPVPLSLDSKLYGTKEDLVTTAEFVVNAGLVV